MVESGYSYIIYDYNKETKEYKEIYRIEGHEVHEVNENINCNLYRCQNKHTKNIITNNGKKQMDRRKKIQNSNR